MLFYSNDNNTVLYQISPFFLSVDVRPVLSIAVATTHMSLLCTWIVTTVY